MSSVLSSVKTSTILFGILALICSCAQPRRSAFTPRTVESPVTTNRWPCFLSGSNDVVVQQWDIVTAGSPSQEVFIVYGGKTNHFSSAVNTNGAVDPGNGFPETRRVDCP